MRIKNYIVIIVCIIFVQFSMGKVQPPEERRKALEALADVEIPLPENTDAFGVGEYLDFGVYVALPGVGRVPVKGGHGILEIPNIVKRNGHICYWLRSKAYSSGIVGQIYPVNDIVESFMDVDSFYSIQFRKDVSEGKFRDKYTIDFDQKNHRAIRKNTFNVETYPRVQDIISAFYYVRTLNLEVGDTIPLPYHDNGGNYPILVIVHRRERVKVKAGEFDCIVVEPVIKVEGLFKRKGRMFIWLTDDRRKMPVKMESKIPVGSVRAVLLKYREGDTDWR